MTPVQTVTIRQHLSDGTLSKHDKPVCSVPHCTEPVSARGACKAHAQRMRNNGGDPLAHIPIRKTGQAVRFLEGALTAEINDCILWPFAKNDHGYGQVWIDGHVAYAHREVCRRAHGDGPEGHQAAHSCGNGHLGCVNPRHLSWKTASENQMDRVAHGTSNRGRAHGMAKFTERQVREIRALKGVLSREEIAARFNTTKKTVGSIHERRSWRWLT